MTSAEIVQKVVRIRSGKHSTSVHNAIQKLKKTPITHAKGRAAVEQSIVHLIDVHHVAITQKMKELIEKSSPSEALMAKICLAMA